MSGGPTDGRRCETCSWTAGAAAGTPAPMRCARRCRGTRKATSASRRSSGTRAPERCTRASSTRSNTGRRRWKCEVWHDDHPPRRRGPRHPRGGRRRSGEAARRAAPDRGGVQRGERVPERHQGGTMPRPVVRRHRRGAPEKRLQLEIRRALETLGFDVTSTSQPQRAMMTAGIPDLYARHPRWKLRLWIEVKTPKGRIRPAQAAWIEAERAAGGHAIVARSLADVIEALKEIGAPIR